VILKNIKKPKEYVTILVGIKILVILSGCVDTSTSFNPDKAIFYDPLDETRESIRIINHNISGNSFYHQNEIQLLVGLKDTNGNLGIDYTLQVEIVYGEGQPMTRRENLTKKLGIQMVTNGSGIAQCTFTYNQYEWPIWVYREGFFQVSTPKIANKTVNSSECVFFHRHRYINRSASSETGIGIILDFEQRNLIEELQTLGKESNGFLDWETKWYTSDFIVNKTTIDSYSVLKGAPLRSFEYKAWAQSLVGVNISYQWIRTEWYTNLDEPLGGINPEEWTATGELPSENITEGWIILQYMYNHAYWRPLFGEWTKWYQISIIDGEEELNWMVSDWSHWLT
jgi:hypothetical protein